MHLGAPGQLQDPAGHPVDQQQRRGGVDRQVAQAVEHLVAGQVVPHQSVSGLGAQEARPAAAVRGVVAALGVPRAEHERVHRLDQREVGGAQRGAASGVPGSGPGQRRQGTRRDVLRAVAVGLRHLDLEPVGCRRDQPAVDPGAAAGGVLDGQQAHRRPAGRPCNGSPGAGAAWTVEGVGARDLEEAGARRSAARPTADQPCRRPRSPRRSDRPGTAPAHRAGRARPACR